MKTWFHPEAEAEHLEAIGFYESRRPGIGARYLDEVESALALALSNPTLHPVTRPPAIRSIVLRTFPHAIHFRNRKGTIEVLAVAHQRRRPEYWHGRAGTRIDHKETE